MTFLLPLLLSLATPAHRVEVSLYVAAVAWGHDPATFRGLAKVEAGPGLETNPRRAASIDPKRRRWGPIATATTYPWRICSLLQLRGGLSGAGGFVMPSCVALVTIPELAAWYGARHLDGWRKACGPVRMYEAYNRGVCGEYGTPRPFTSAVMSARRDWHCHLSNGRDVDPHDDEVFWGGCGPWDCDPSACLIHGSFTAAVRTARKIR